MKTKIKVFFFMLNLTSQKGDELTEEIEQKVNAFTKNKQVIDIKVNTKYDNKNGLLFMYSVIYKDISKKPLSIPMKDPVRA